MKTASRAGTVLLCCIVGSLICGLSPVRAQQGGNPAAHDTAKNPVPPFHASPPSGPLPPVLDPSRFPDGETRNIYALAARVEAILYQQPCYCGCDKEDGHKSLLDCYTGYHASGCSLCKKEAVFAATEYSKGKTAVQIREEIIAGKWKTVDLSAYGDKPQGR